MEKISSFDFWYAVNNTEVVLLPSRHLETFGATDLKYHMVSEMMDSTVQVRVREGRMQASQPRIIAPEAYSKVVLEGFGAEAREYIEWLREHEGDLRVLQYGYSLKQESFSEHIVTDNLQSVVARVKSEVEARDDSVSAVLIGVDTPWDVCLVKLFWEIIKRSARTNVMQMERRGLFGTVDGVSRAMRNEVDEAFLAASRDPSLIKPLAAKLRSVGLFEEYQDRFFSLVKAAKGLGGG